MSKKTLKKDIHMYEVDVLPEPDEDPENMKLRERIQRLQEDTEEYRQKLAYLKKNGSIWHMLWHWDNNL